MAFCGLFITAPFWAEAQQVPFQNEQFREEQPQTVWPKHKPKSVVHRLDPAVQLRHDLRDKINSGLVGIVSEGTDETVDMALSLTAQPEHDGLPLLPIAGAGATQNAEDVMFTRGIDFGIVETHVLDPSAHILFSHMAGSPPIVVEIRPEH
jgi:hypothetical protein